MENLAKNVAVLSLVVIANLKSIIEYKYVKKDVRDQIIKYDQITNTLKDFLGGYSVEVLSNNAMVRLGDKLLEAHVESENAFLQKYVEYRVTSQPSNSSEDVCSEEEVSIETEEVNEINDRADNLDVIVNDQIIEKQTSQTSEIIKEIDMSVENKNRRIDLSDDKIEALRNSLKEYRLNQSRVEKIKAYFIFNNSQMEEIISLLPHDKQALIACNGFGEKKYEKYGEAIIDIVNQYL